MIHHIKCHQEPFEAMMMGRKLHEFRKNNRNYQVGDELVIREYDPQENDYTGRAMVRIVTYVGTGFGIPDGFVCLSVVPEDMGEMVGRMPWALGVTMSDVGKKHFTHNALANGAVNTRMVRGEFIRLLLDKVEYLNQELLEMKKRALLPVILYREKQT